VTINVITTEINLVEVIISIVVSILLVYLFEWLKKPSVTVELITPLLLKDNRKLLKVNVKIFKSGALRKFFPWQSNASNARLKGQLIEIVANKEIILQEYTVKWDSNPEPLDYSTGELRRELLPATSAPENLLVGDQQTAAVAIKHQGESGFYIYDGNYYGNRDENKISEKKMVLRLNFSSNSISKSRDFIIINPNKSTNGFILQEFD